MKIRVDKIPEEGEPIEGSVSPSEVNLDMPGYSLTETIQFAGQVSKNGDDILVQGKLRGVVNSECSRCLKNFTMAIGLDMDVVYVPEKERRGKESDIIELDPNLAFYEGDTIELLHEIKDLVLVSLPIQPICDASCKGLCLHCGADLNVTQCECEHEVVGSPFAQLKDLKSKLEEK